MSFFFFSLLHRWRNRGRTSRGSVSWVLLSPTITSRPTEGRRGGLTAPTGLSDGPRDCRLTVKKKTTQTQALRTIHAFRVHLQLLMSKKTKNARRLHIIFDSAPFSYDTVTAWRDTNRALCARSATSGRGGGGTRLCEWSASHDTHPAVWCKRAWQGSRGNVKVNG